MAGGYDIGASLSGSSSSGASQTSPNYNDSSGGSKYNYGLTGAPLYAVAAIAGLGLVAFMVVTWLFSKR